MRTLIVSVAATALLAGPGFAKANNGKAYGHDPKVCLVTFANAQDAAGQADADVIKAQYLPLRIAMMKEMQNDAASDIYTYGDDGFVGPGVDYHYAGDSTEATCEYLAGINGGSSDD